MKINIVQICQYKYPGQVEKMNITFRQPEQEILIATWNVPNEPQPTEQELIDYGIANQRAIEIDSTSRDAAPSVQNVIDATAKAKSYADGVSCASYATSTNAQWKAEAQAFIDWRDSVWNDLYQLLATLQGNQDPIPSVQEIINSLPAIQWP